MRKVFFASIVIFFSFSLWGCVSLLGNRNMSGGVAISQDTARFEKDTSFDALLSATYRTLQQMGTILTEDKKAGRLTASVAGAEVETQVSLVTPKTVRVEVKAHKNLFPDLDLAIQIVNKISEKFPL